MIRAGPYGRTSPTASSTAPIFFTTVASFSLQRQPAPLPRERRLVHLDAPLLRNQQVVGVVVAVPALRVVQTRLVREHHPLDHHRRVAERHVRLLVPFHPGAVRQPTPMLTPTAVWGRPSRLMSFNTSSVPNASAAWRTSKSDASVPCCST